MAKDNLILDLSKSFAIRIIKMYKYLTEEKKEYVLSNQVLRSGTSIGANVRESVNAQSQLDFKSKMSIALKEANETEYWLELLYETDYITEEMFNSMISDNKYIVGTLVNILKTMKAQL